MERQQAREQLERRADASAAGVAIPPQIVVRIIGDTQSPWMLRIWSSGAAPAVSGASSRLLAIMLVVVILSLWGTVYFMARAIRREAKVSRLQSDFVAAVSHEFRTPLTTVRQLSEMLDMDPIVVGAGCANGMLRRLYGPVMQRSGYMTSVRVSVATVIDVKRYGSTAVELTYKDPSGNPACRLAGLGGSLSSQTHNDEGKPALPWANCVEVHCRLGTGEHILDRRIEPRMSCTDIVEVHWRVNGLDHHCSAILSDISPSGAGLRQEHPIPLFTTVHIRHTSGELTGTVRNCSSHKGGYFLGVEFEQGCRWSPRNFRSRNLTPSRLRS